MRHLLIVRAIGVGLSILLSGSAATAGVSDPNEPNDSFGAATPIGCPGFDSLDTAIDPLGDVDFYVLTGPAGQVVSVDVDADDNGSALDAVLGIFDSGLNQVAFQDDAPSAGEPLDTLDPFLYTAFPEDGLLYIAVASFPDFQFVGDGDTTGFYDLHVTCDDAPPAPPAGGLLASTGTAGRALIDVNRITGAGTLRAPQGTFGSVTEIEFRDDGLLLGATGGGNQVLLQIDPVTGVESAHCVHDTGSLNGLEYVDGVLFAGLTPAPGQDSQLVTVGEPDEFNSCALTTIGSTGVKNLGGLAYDDASGVLYGCVAGGSSGGDLVTCDMETGVCTPVGPTGYDQCSGLEFGPDGLLYGGIGGQSADAGKLVTIDPVTGAGTDVGPTGWPVVSGLAFVPGAEALTNEPSVAICGDTAHYAWARLEEGGLDPNIYYRRCTLGVDDSCTNPRRIVGSSARESRPTVACDGPTVLVVWEDRRNGNVDIAYRRSTNGGADFLPRESLVSAGTDETRPQLVLSEGVAIVAWEDRRNGNTDLGYRRSTNGGANWEPFRFLVRGPLEETDPALALDGETAVLTWVDRRNGSDDLALRRSLNRGQDWQPLTFLVRGPAAESSPTIGLDGTNVMVAWEDLRFGNADLASRRSTNSGQSFDPLKFQVKGAQDDTDPVLRLNDLDDALLVWVDLRSGERNISFRHSEDGGANWGGTSRVVFRAGSDQIDPACALVALDAACVWSDGRTPIPLPKARESADGGATWPSPLIDVD